MVEKTAGPRLPRCEKILQLPEIILVTAEYLELIILISF